MDRKGSHDVIGNLGHRIIVIINGVGSEMILTNFGWEELFEEANDLEVFMVKRLRGVASNGGGGC